MPVGGIKQKKKTLKLVVFVLYTRRIETPNRRKGLDEWGNFSLGQNFTIDGRR